MNKETSEWLDKENHVYIYYTVDEIKDALGCGNKKAGALLAELDDKKGIGLITRVRQGLGRPEFTRRMTSLYYALKESGVVRQYWNYNRNIMKNFRPQIDALSDLFIQTYHRDDFAEHLDKVEREQARQSRAYGAYSRYKENMLHGKEGIYARLGNAILRELQEYDRTVTAQDVSKTTRDQRAPGSTLQHEAAPVHNMRLLRSGLFTLEHLLKVNYEKTRNQREAERLQEEIARRGDRGFEI